MTEATYLTYPTNEQYEFGWLNPGSLVRLLTNGRKRIYTAFRELISVELDQVTQDPEN